MAFSEFLDHSVMVEGDPVMIAGFTEDHALIKKAALGYRNISVYTYGVGSQLVDTGISSYCDWAEIDAEQNEAEFNRLKTEEVARAALRAGSTLVRILIQDGARMASEGYDGTYTGRLGYETEISRLRKLPKEARREKRKPAVSVTPNFERAMDNLAAGNTRGIADLLGRGQE